MVQLKSNRNKWLITLTIKGKKCKLSVFPHNHFGTFIEDDLFLNKDDFPSISTGDVVEIYNPDPECDDYRPRLLLKVSIDIFKITYDNI